MNSGAVSVACIFSALLLPSFASPFVHHNFNKRSTLDNTQTVPFAFPPVVSLNRWGGFDSLEDFDSFYGYQNFGGFIQESASLAFTAVQEEELECHSTSIDIIQQQLAVIREYVKKLISVQICEVEVQTIVLTQFRYGLYGFDQDLRHSSGRSVGFDGSIARRIGDLHDDAGDLSSANMNFSGYDVGGDLVSPCGGNWDSNTSPSSVASAYDASLSAAALSEPPYQASSNTTSDCAAGCDATSPAISTSSAVPNTNETSADADTATVPADSTTPDSSSSSPNPASD